MKLLVSACLLGERVRYDGQAQALELAQLRIWMQQGLIIGCCPEVAGGLPVPRPAAERQPDGAICTADGEDVTAAFTRGAEAALALCLRHDVRCALLKERSPSCGSQHIYSGRFDGTLVAGEGLTAALLRQHGIRVFSALQVPEFIAHVQTLLSQGASSSVE